MGAALALVLGRTALAEPQALGASIAVTTTVDEYNAVAPCSLREAVQTANDDADFGGCVHTGGALTGATTINVPVGTYTLTRDGIDDDANLTADLDIDGSVTLDGAGGAGDVVIRLEAGDSGRIVHVINGTVSLKDMTLRDGNLPGGRFGGGLRTNPGTTTTLTNVVVGVNSADRGGGGILNAGVMTLNGSSVTNNHTDAATQGGGGILNTVDAALTLNDSRVLNNAVVVAAAPDAAGGGGIFNDLGASLTLDNSWVDNNLATGASADDNSAGGGILSLSDLNLVQSTISNNTARSGFSKGGGLSCLDAVTHIERSLITGNTVDTNQVAGNALGGGIRALNGLLTVSNSIISNNIADGDGSGGGLSLLGIGQATFPLVAQIANTTISGNQARRSAQIIAPQGLGGGIRASSKMSLAVVNSTVSGNSAESDGGGIEVDSAGFSGSLSNVTIVDNVSNSDNVDGGAGGGAFIQVAATVTIRNSVIAGNLEGGIGDHDDCDGTMISGHNNLIQQGSGCALLDDDATDLRDTPAKLGAFAANGGPDVGASSGPIAGMGTHLPASDSPLIDHGNSSSCKDQGNVDLVTDQRGFVRAVDGPDAGSIATCDTGAVEFGSALPVVNGVFADSFE